MTCSLKEVNLPKAHYLGLNSFSEQNKIETFNAPELEAIGSGCFYKMGTENLELDLPELDAIEGHIANLSCKKLLIPNASFYNSISYDPDTDTITPGSELETAPYFPSIKYIEELDISSLNLVRNALKDGEYNNLKILSINDSSVPLNVAFGGSYDGEIIVPESLKVINMKHMGTNAALFQNCANIEAINIDDISGSIASSFLGMTNLSKLNNINGENTLTTNNSFSLGDSSFRGCASLENLNLIGYQGISAASAVINDCANLEYVKFSSTEGGADFGTNNFVICPKLTDIYFDINEDSVPSFGAGCFKLQSDQPKFKIHIKQNFQEDKKVEWENAFADFAASVELSFEE